MSSHRCRLRTASGQQGRRLDVFLIARDCGGARVVGASHKGRSVAASVALDIAGTSRTTQTIKGYVAACGGAAFADQCTIIAWAVDGGSCAPIDSRAQEFGGVGCTSSEDSVLAVIAARAS